MNYNESAAFLKSKNITQPTIGIVLGTGLHKLTELVNTEQTIAYSDIPHFPVSTVEFQYSTIAMKQFTNPNNNVYCNTSVKEI